MIKTIFRVSCLIAFIAISVNFTVSKSRSTPQPLVQDLSGRYIGGWSSTPPKSIYEDIPISAILTKVDNAGNYSGEFFFTGVHMSCCKSGKNDGTLAISMDGDTITKYEYSDILPKCHGYFSGSGFLDSLNTLKVNFKGYDCEGQHQNASLFLRKQ